MADTTRGNEQDRRDTPFVSFVTPVFNEEGSIAAMMKNLHDVAAANPGWGAEIVFIEDGSRDNSRSILSEEIRKYPEMRLICHETNRGFNYSFREGLGCVRGRYVMYVGADEEFDCSEIPNFINVLLNEGAGHADMVLGVRWQRNAYRLHRFFLSVIYIFFLNFLFKIRVNDYNWSQVWPVGLVREMDLGSRSLFILPEIIIKAHDLGVKIREIPSNHRGRQYGKSSLNFRIFGHAFWEAIRFWIFRRSKKYAVFLKEKAGLAAALNLTAEAAAGQAIRA